MISSLEDVPPFVDTQNVYSPSRGFTLGTFLQSTMNGARRIHGHRIENRCVLNFIHLTIEISSGVFVVDEDKSRCRNCC